MRALTAYVLLLAAPLGQAQLVEEGFAYPINATLDGQSGGSGWSGAWSHVVGTPGQGTFEEGLSYSSGVLSLPEAGAQRLRIAIAAFIDQGIERAVDSAAAPPALVTGSGLLGANGSTLWLAFLGHSGSPGLIDDARCGLSLYAGAQERLFIGRDGQSIDWRLEGVAGGPIVGSTGISAVPPALCVVRMDFSGGSGQAWLWIDPALDSEPLTASADASVVTNALSFDVVRAHSRWANSWNLDELRIAANFFEAVGNPVPSNQPPAAPLINEPATEGQALNPADVHMETSAFSDPNPGDQHDCTDWEIWTVAANQRVWFGQCLTGPEMVHAHLGDGVFEGSHAGLTALLPNLSYQLRVRHRDSSGDAANEWSAFSTRSFVTTAASTHTPLQVLDVVELPLPRWELEGGATPVELAPGNQTPASLTVEGEHGELLLFAEGQANPGNALTNPAAIVGGHVDMRLVVRAGDQLGGLSLAASDFEFVDEHCHGHTLLLPSLALLPGQEAYLWVAFDGSTYWGSAGQSSPDFSNPARLLDTPWVTLEDGFDVEVVASGFQMPVNIAFNPNPGPDPDDVLFYVTELYGQVRTVSNDGTVGTYASGLLNYTPSGAFPGSGEQGLTGIAIDELTGDLYVSKLKEVSGGVWGGTENIPEVVQLWSADGGKTMAGQSMVIDFPGETQGQSHQISTLEFLPDNTLLVHMGDGFDSSTAQDLTSYRGKVLRLQTSGQPPADNPLYNVGDGINAKDYVWVYGVRNPFGGDRRAADGLQYMVGNGPSVDRFARMLPGTNYGWNGGDASMQNHALYNWAPATGPANMAFVQPESFGGSGFPSSLWDQAFVTLSGPTYASGPQANGKRIVRFELAADGSVLAGPTPFVQYTGAGKSTAVALAAGPDGLYFSELYSDDGQGGPTAPGARILRVHASAEHDCNQNGVEDACDIATGNSLDLDQDGTPDDCVAPLLGADVVELSVSQGGTQNLYLEAGASWSGALYFLLGTLSGSSPGLPVGSVWLPLNPDAYTNFTLSSPNTPPLAGSSGALSPTGSALASFTLGPASPPALVGLLAHHAYVVFDLAGFSLGLASNPAPIALLP